MAQRTLFDVSSPHSLRARSRNSQKAKFKSFLWYFEWLNSQSQDDVFERKIKLSRKVCTTLNK